MNTSAKILRESVKSILRNMGSLESNKAFCCEHTYIQCHILVEFGKNTTLSINDLAAKLKIDKSAVSRTVDDLVKKCLLKREQNPTDRRYVKISLTTEGLRMVKDIDSNSLYIFEQILSHVPPAKIETAIEGVHLFSEALKHYFDNSILERNKE